MTGSHHPTAAGGTSDLTGTFLLIRLALRRDRVLLPVWILAITGMVVATASAIAELYSDAAGRFALGATIQANPALKALTGPVFDTSVGGLIAWRVTSIASVLAALMSVLVVVRHTRAEEESGRAELIGAGAMGRHALPTAAVLTVSAANGLVALLIVLALTAQGLPAAGALAFALAIAGTGWVFTGLAAFSAQLTVGARSANAIALTVLGGSVLLRAAGDAADSEAVSWVSPLGWAQRVRPFAGERWWVLVMFAGAGLALVVVAGLVARRRDLGAGLLAARHGPGVAARYLAGPLALAWRLHRGALTGWAIAFAVGGGAFGALAQSVGELVEGNPQISEMIARFGGGGVLVDTFLATQMGLLGVVAGGYAVQATLRLRSEESALRAEPVLALAVPRWRWVASHLFWALAGSALIMAAGGLAAGLAHGLRVGDPAGQAPRVLGAALAQVPAVWVLAGLAMLLFGLLPRLTGLAWAALVAFAVLGQLGELLQLDERIRGLSPYFHVPRLPTVNAEVAPLLWLTVVATALIVGGITAFRERDLTSP